MEKDQPPPYSAATGHAPAHAFQVPQAEPLLEKTAGAPALGYPSQGYPPQGYPPNQGYPPPTGPGFQQGGVPVYPPLPGQPGYPPGQAAYIPQPPAGGTTVVVTSPTFIAQYGPQPQPMSCPHCHAVITTRLQSEPGMRTHILALILCLIGCIPCCLIPYCVDSCQNRNHYCPSCNAFLGAYDNDSWGRRF